MNYYEEQKKEIATIKNRQITLAISDADVRRICEKAGQAGLTVPELLQNFIGDLVGGTYSNGSDERAYAQQWFDRCWFGAMPDETFLRYLINTSDTKSMVFRWNSIQENKLDLAQAEASLQTQGLTDEDMAAIQEVIDYCKEEITYDMDELAKLFADYKKFGGTDSSLEAGMEKVLKWQAEMELLSGDNYLQKQKCRVCGCTDDHACPGGCYWVAPDLCSRCADGGDET
ncbi:MAG: hypothetical protein RSF86_06435 [Angelakisella sp.]